MLQVHFIKDNKERVIEGLTKRNFTDFSILDEILALDEERKNVQTIHDELKSKQNKLSKEIGNLFKQGKREEAEAMKAAVADLKNEIDEKVEQSRAIKEKLEAKLLEVPNVPHPSVVQGKGEEDNEVYQEWKGELPKLGKNALPHWELAKKYDLFDLELGVKITGSGFPLFRHKGAKLQRALINFFLDEGHAAGYEEIIPPLMVNEATARATGQLPDKEGQMYHVTLDNFYLIPTAEVPLTNIFRGDTVDVAALPIKVTGHTPCFRREAGAAGKDTRGLNRVHQFDKIEIVQIQHPDKSYDTLYEMLDHVAGLLDKLELPYRILRLCGGDLGFTSALTYDFEVWSAAQERWLEVSSVSNFETFQSHRLNLKYKDGKKKTLVHTLNGSALALARIFAALLENNQTPDGIVIPKALRPYTKFDLMD